MKKILLIIIILFIYAHNASAALVSIDTPINISNQNQFSVIVNLDTDGNSINSVDFSISYPKDILTFKGYKEDGSIKKLWLVYPKEESGVIKFSGVIPGGVEGVYNPDKAGLQPIPLVVLLFSPKSNGSGVFNVIRSEVLKNDGLGTQLFHEKSISYITVSIINPIAQDNENNNIDTIPPESFTIQHIPSGFFSRTPAMISFSTTDLDSGVEKYQLLISRDSWKDVVSPLPVRRGILNRSVIVRAVDFAGNSRQATIEILGLVSPSQLVAIIGTFLICYFMFFVVKRKR